MKQNRMLSRFALVSVALVLAAGSAFAGTDATFSTLLTQLNAYLSGSGGKVAIVVTIFGGVFGFAITRKWEFVGGAFFLAIVIAYLPGALTAMLTATL